MLVVRCVESNQAFYFTFSTTPGRIVNRIFIIFAQFKCPFCTHHHVLFDVEDTRGRENGMIL